MADQYREPLVFLLDLPWVKEIVFGPSIRGFSTFGAYVDASADFLSFVDTPVCSAVAAYWFGYLKKHGTYPRYKGDWRAKLAPVAGCIAVRERTDPMEPSRYRYVGTTINEMTGIDMTGHSVADYLPLPVEEVLRLEHLFHDEGRVGYSRRDYGNIEKGYMKAVAVNFQFVDEKGVPRYNMTAGDFSVPA